MIDPGGLRRESSFDDAGRLVAMTYEDGGVARFTHDARYNVESKTRPSGLEIQFRHDGASRPAGWDTSTGESATLAWNAQA